jgi:alpha-glucuronidase
LHHVPYTYKLHSGKTVIQSIYDSHYEGANTVEQYVRQWKTLRGLVDEDRYDQVLAQLEYQAGQAEVWRDAVTLYFQRMSNIPDDKDRVGHYPSRTEAEAMTLDGYETHDVKPAEDASGAKAVTCPARAEVCSAAMKYSGAPGWYDLRVQYFDQANGAARYRVYVGKQLVDEWSADLNLPRAIGLSSTTSTRRLIPGVALRPGDEIRIEGKPDRMDLAGLDYVELVAPVAQASRPAR